MYNVKEIVKRKLYEAYRKLDNAREELAPVAVAHIMSQNSRWSAPKDVQRVLGKDDRLKNRIEDVESIVSILDKMDFATLFPKSIEKCLNSNGVFCDRYRFYYTKDLFIQSDDDIAKIVMAEFFNAYQDYFSNGKISKQQGETVAACSLLLMSYIGLIPEKLPFNQTVRRHLMQEVRSRHPHIEKLSTVPTEEQVNHMFNLMFSDSDERLAKVKHLDMLYGVNTYQIFPVYIFPLEYKLSWVNKETTHNNESLEIFFEGDKRIGPGSKGAQLAKNYLLQTGQLRKRDR